MLQLTPQIKGTAFVYVVNKQSTPTNDTPTYVVEAFEAFKNLDAPVDFIKISNHFYFFVKENSDLEKMRVAGFNIRQQLDKKTVELTIVGNGETTLALAEGLALSNYQFLKYFKDADEREYALENIFLLGDIAADDVSKMNNVIKAVFWARDMVNEPHSYLNATQLAKEMQEIGDEAHFHVEVFRKAEIEALKMGGLLAVNKGSVQPPTFTVMEYKPANPINQQPVVLVGKGVVYDTGGLSLKPTPNSMDLMKSDMGGAAMMAGTMYAAALNKLNVHIIALVPATDNRPGGDAYAPGDIITMMDGTTVEVLNTDAEGRMILADAISYATKYNPELIINSATLTGAALIAAGTRAACLMSNASNEVNNALLSSGNKVYERMVQLPLWDDYKEQLKSSCADLKNIGGRMAGTITAGKFLEHFAKAPFVHIDIAGPAFTEAPENYKGLGGTGTGIRTLHDFFVNYKK
ncbi:leucyl aminopeptidase [Flavobacterium sp. xlx-214]|uniref:leucyl aminopeptidase family protein n=1 Tax=unclassified Flavobacterium TaxID=196869 RepID=UPI0013D639BA|nr:MULTISPECIES: leucyl aminopeptidase [unclassified Flavobacterium]MBA5792645.1 leucyl aminopeptidase [Flavobacterium sp. xlx-221]QMI83793.1 leucyl aminopeptidase [Flavobacterium sp. xlx-214]